MRAEAEGRGWLAGEARIRQSKKRVSRTLGDLLALLEDEADPRLGPGWLEMNALAQHFERLPGRAELIQALRANGFAAGRRARMCPAAALRASSAITHSIFAEQARVLNRLQVSS